MNIVGLPNIKQLKRIRKLIKLDVTDFAKTLVNDEYLSWCWLETPNSSYKKTGLYLDSLGHIRVGNLIKDNLGVRPTIKYKTIKEINDIIDNINDADEVHYGEYIQSNVNEEIQNELFKKLKNNQLKMTEKKYHIYEKKTYDYSVNKYIINNYTEFLYNDKKYICYKDKWFEIKPITWYVDKKSKRLISKSILISGIPYSLNKKERDGLPLVTNSVIYEYLNKYFINDILPSKVIKKEVVKIDNESKVNILVKDIRNHIKGKSYEESITIELNKLIEEYNNKLRNNNFLTINYEPTNLIVNNMEIKLEIILSNVKEYNLGDNKFNDMYEYIYNIQNFKYDNDELQNDIKMIYTKILPYLNDFKKTEKYKQRINNIINNVKNDITMYIASKINIDINNDYNIKLPYHSKEELIQYIRKEIHPLLEEITKEVNQYDVQKSINESITKIIDSNYEISNNKMISLYLNQINESYNKINEYLKSIDYLDEYQKEEWLNEISSIMTNDIDYKEGLQIVLNQLKNKWVLLNKIMYEIEDYINEKEYIDFNTITR